LYRPFTFLSSTVTIYFRKYTHMVYPRFHLRSLR
jgi:hypothetical protein